MRVFVTGGTGLVGSRLIRTLAARGDRVVLLTRRPDVATQLGIDCEVIPGDPAQAGQWQDTIATCDAVVNLAGANVFGKRWSADYQRELRDSRVKSTDHCATSLAKNPTRADGSPKVLVNASAIGYYGPHGDEEVDETTPKGSDFLAGLCADWEKAAQPASNAGVRVVLGRTGIVLDPLGGALKGMLTPFKLCLGGPVASGKQYMSWIHYADEIGLLLFALDQPNARGPMNLTAPQPRSNKEFGKALGRALGRPAFVWTPGFAFRLGLGPAAEIVTTGQRVLPNKALAWGYQFRFPSLEQALADILK